MMSGRSVTGLKSFFFNSHGNNDRTSREGKNLKKLKGKGRDMVSCLNFMFLFF